MTPDEITIIVPIVMALTLFCSFRVYEYIQTHAIITRVELNRLRYDVQSKESQITELQAQLDAIRAPKDGRGRPVSTGQFELGLKAEPSKTQKFGPFLAEIDGKEYPIYMVWYAGEKTKYEDGMVLVRRNGSEKWLLPDDVQQSKDIKVQPWWYVTENGKHVYPTEHLTRHGKKTTWSFNLEKKQQPKKIKSDVYE